MIAQQVVWVGEKLIPVDVQQLAEEWPTEASYHDLSTRRGCQDFAEEAYEQGVIDDE